MINVSVVIVNYNSGLFLERCIRSLLKSDYPIETVVVDNASKDGSMEFLASLTSDEMPLKVLRNSQNLGFSAAINLGLESSTAKYVLLLNPDCLVFAHTIRVLSEVLDEEAGVGIVGGLVFNFEGSEQRGCRRREPTLARSIAKVLRLRRRATMPEDSGVDLTDQPLPVERIPVDAVSGSFLLIRRELFVSLKGMDESFFLHFEDLDLCRRVRDAGWKVLFAPDISIFHYQGSSGEASPIRILWHKHRGVQRYYRKHHRKHLAIHVMVFLAAWGHFILHVIRCILVPRVRKSLRVHPELSDDTEVFPWMMISPTNGRKRRLLVLGQVDKVGQDFLRVGLEKGWLIYVENQVEVESERGGVHWINSEYLTKVPSRDAPEFAAVLNFERTSRPNVSADILKKLRVQRMAMVHFPPEPPRHVDDKSQTLSDNNKISGSKRWSHSHSDCFDYKAREFLIPVAAAPSGIGPAEKNFEEFSEQCYSWLSE